MNRITATSIAAAGLLGAGATLAGFGFNSTNSALESTTIASAEGAAAGSYAVDAVHSSVLFKIRHAGLAYFYGTFEEFGGTISIDPDNIEAAQFNITVETGSVDTNNRSRDGHVKNADFFNARQYPKASFTSTSISEVSEGVYQLNGDFEFHGKTLPVSAELTHVTFGKQRDADAMGFHAVFTIARSEFGITKYVDADNPESGPLGDNVEITVSMEAVSQ
ncbi:MAG: YceI family protein [Erythrobacter sp.]|nr:YceI family protein [Erythrobacter sp.]